jgi:hypothetical protein
MDQFEYDVFKGTPKKNPLWLGSVKGWERAVELTNRMAARLPGDYFVSSAVTREVVMVVKQETEEAMLRPGGLGPHLSRREGST